MNIARFVTITIAILLVSATAFAEDSEIYEEEFGITIQTPDDWDVEEDDKAVANFKHPGSESQIQVIGTQLMSEDVSDVFFDTFHDTLEESDFEETEREEGKEIGDREGTSTIYEFEHADVTLEIRVFEFLVGDTAWLAIGYMEVDEGEEHAEDYESVVGTIAFDDDED